MDERSEQALLALIDIENRRQAKIRKLKYSAIGYIAAAVFLAIIVLAIDVSVVTPNEFSGTLKSALSIGFVICLTVGVVETVLYSYLRV